MHLALKKTYNVSMCFQCNPTTVMLFALKMFVCNCCCYCSRPACLMRPMRRGRIVGNKWLNYSSVPDVFFPPLSKMLDPCATAGWASQQVHWGARGGVSAGTRPDLCPGSKFWTWTEWRGRRNSAQWLQIAYWVLFPPLCSKCKYLYLWVTAEWFEG